MEKQNKLPITTPASLQYSASDIEAGSSQEKTYLSPSTIGSWMKNVLLSVETKGIERVTDEERQHNTTKVWHACTFWYVQWIENDLIYSLTEL
jgi:hypothetical protein